MLRVHLCIDLTSSSWMLELFIVLLQFEAVNAIYLYKIQLPGLVHIFVYDDSHLSLNQLYALLNVCETCVITDY